MRKVHVEVTAKRRGNVALHPMPANAILAGSCAQWTAHDVPHWECQIIQCGNCMPYPVTTEEAHEDVGAEQILFHVYEYNVSVGKDGKEH
jgi:hypothetical protein